MARRKKSSENDLSKVKDYRHTSFDLLVRKGGPDDRACLGG